MNAVSQQFPSLDRSWTESVIRELIARGAESSAIGEALATADAHCADSGEPALEAFGTPSEYAASVRLRPEDLADERLGRQLRTARPSFLGVAGMMLAFRVIDSSLTGTQVPVRVGDVLGVVAILAVAVLAVRYVGLLLRHQVASMVVLGALVAGIVLLPILLTHVLLTLPVIVGAVLAALAVVGSGVWATAIGDEPEPVLDPRPGAKAPASSAAFVILTRWLFVVATLVGGAFIYLIHAVGG